MLLNVTLQKGRGRGGVRYASVKHARKRKERCLAIKELIKN